MQSYINSLRHPSSLQLSSESPVQFDSYIECGNLEQVHKVSNNEFDLILKPDTNTERHTHWFMFKVITRNSGSLKFNILNFMKVKSLIRKGLRPVAYTHESGYSYVRDLQYFKTFEESNKFFTVSFEFDFKSHQEVTISFCRPYGFSKMLSFFSEIEGEKSETNNSVCVIKNKILYRRDLLCHSLGGLPVHLLTITDEEGPSSKKKSAIFTARVHPGETVASFVLEGFIRFLLSPSAQAVALRKAFVFKIVPMLNPDGVVCGNSRTSLAGVDLNRIWVNPDPVLHPCIYYTKLFIQKFTKKHEPLIYADFHGHGKKLGSFIYGCNKIVNGSFATWTKVRLFPRIVAKNTVLFSYNKCIFSVDPNKEGTGRVVIWKEIGISNSFTIETSLFGYHNGEKIIAHSNESYIELGENFAKSLLEYSVLLKSLEKELQLTNGWLKPSKFKEVSGTPALQLLSKKIENDKKELKFTEFRERAKTSNRPNSKSVRIRAKENLEPVEIGVFPDWKSYFTCEEVRIAQKNIEMRIEDSPESSSTESSMSEKEEELNFGLLRVYSPPVDDTGFWTPSIKPLKPIKKEPEPNRCKFIQQHTSDFSGCYLDNIALKNTASETFGDNRRNMFFSRAERSKMYKQRVANTRSMSSKRNSKTMVETADNKGITEKIMKVRPKIQKNYYFSKDRQHFKPQDLCINSFRVSPIKRDSLKKL